MLPFRPEGGRSIIMPSAWTQNSYHAVFSTKDRLELIKPESEERLYPFMGGILRDLKCSLLAVGGMPDHVHLLVRHPSNLSHSEMVQHVKSRSSKWIHETSPELRRFVWQEGYGGFTVSKSVCDAVEFYIRNQKEHHKRQDFKSEFLELLRLHGLEFDEAEVFK
jgi:putative transposase